MERTNSSAMRPLSIHITPKLVHTHQTNNNYHLINRIILNPLRSILLLLLHLTFHLILFYLIKPKPKPVSKSTRPINSSLPPNLFISKPPHHHLNPPCNKLFKLTNNHLAAVLITTNNNNPLSLQLALDFATIGYHVFIQVSSHSQLTRLIIRWQRLKSKLINQKTQTQTHHQNNNINKHNILHHLFPSNHQEQQQQHQTPPPGTIIPLLYLTHDISQRLDAISTISAYLRENSIDMLSLINIINPHRIRKSYPTSSSHSPTSPTFPLSRPNHTTPLSTPSSPSISCRPLTGITSPSAQSEQYINGIFQSPPMPPSLPTSSSSSCHNNELYNYEPLPLSISSENYIFDAFGDVLLGPLSTIQDLLLLLKHHRGRIINIWDAHRYPTSGLNKILLDAFQQTNRVLQSELEPLDIPVSAIFQPTANSFNLPTRTAQSILTRDPRSLLSETSDSDLLDIFTKNTAESMSEEASRLQTYSNLSLSHSFDMVRSALETNYPCPVYPIGIREVVDQISQLSGLGTTLSKIESLLGV